MPPDMDIFDWMELFFAALGLLFALGGPVVAARRFFRRAWREGMRALGEGLVALWMGAWLATDAAVVRHSWLGISPGYWMEILFGPLFVILLATQARKAAHEFSIGARREGIHALGSGIYFFGWGTFWMTSVYTRINPTRIDDLWVNATFVVSVLLAIGGLCMSAFASFSRRAQSQPAS